VEKGRRLTPEELKEEQEERVRLGLCEEGRAEELFEEEKRIQETAARRQKIMLESICIQGKLEGLFRQLYQACTQQAIPSNFKIHNKMIDSIEDLWEDLRALYQDHERMASQAEQQAKPNGPVN
jgi:hypothetical protein